MRFRTQKYRNKKTTLPTGERFDSRKEARRYGELQLLERAGEITDLERQVEFRIIVNNKLICKYIADFTYFENGKLVVEDVKSPPTRKNRAYRIKVKLMEAVHGITIREV